MYRRIITPFLFPLLVSAEPVPALVDTIFCTVQRLLILGLKNNADATSYCSSYLSIPTQTRTAVFTVTPAPQTNTASVIVTKDPITRFQTRVAQITITDSYIDTFTKVETETITSVNSTTTLGCLDSAYSAPTTSILDEELVKRIDIDISVNLFGNLGPSQISSACLCLLIPTATTVVTRLATLNPNTVTVTKTGTFTPVVDVTTTAFQTEVQTVTVSVQTVTSTTTETEYAIATAFEPTGIAYRGYNNAGNVGSFDAAHFKSLTPDFSGIMENLNFATPNWPSYASLMITLDDGKQFDSNVAGIVSNGFFIAKEPGSYTFFTDGNSIDNYGYLWIGNPAYQWNDGDTVYKALRVTQPYIGGTYSITLNEGDAIPFTWLWANAGGPGWSHILITTPSGKTENTTGYFIPSCDSDTFE